MANSDGFSDPAQLLQNAAQAKAAVDDLNSSLKDMNTQMENADALIDNEMEKFNLFFSSLQSSSDQAVAGLIKGTETWQQALSKTIVDLEVKFTQSLARQLLAFIETQTQQLLINQQTNDAKNASDELSDDASSASHIAKLVKQIQSDAAATYAGVFAYMSPVLGPAAAVPAGVAAAGVAAMEGLVSLDVGAWNLNSDTVAQLHQGEMVVPKTFAQGLRENGGAGGGEGAGGSYTININAIDTQTGADFLRNNAQYVASALASQVRNFNSSVPAWK